MATTGDGVWRVERALREKVGARATVVMAPGFVVAMIAYGTGRTNLLADIVPSNVIVYRFRAVIWVERRGALASEAL